MRYPRNPACSMRYPAWLPGGFSKVEPIVAPAGWRVLRHSSISPARAASPFGSLGRNPNVAASTTYSPLSPLPSPLSPLLLIRLPRYSNSNHSADLSTIAPSGSSTVALRNTLATSPSKAPALPTTAPPTVPGNPAAHSNPASPRSTASRASTVSSAPVSAYAIAPSNSMCAARLTTTSPRTPLSATSTLQPPPSNRQSTPCRRASSTVLTTSSTLSQTINKSAGPPTRTAV